MKNDLLEIVKRSHEIIDMLMGGIPLTMYDAEMEVLDILTDELLVSIGFENNYIPLSKKDLKTALMNMYFFGKICEKNEK
jgi:hypothetical protein